MERRERCEILRYAQNDKADRLRMTGQTNSRMTGQGNSE